MTRTSWIMIAGAIIFFASTSFLYLSRASVFNSPDEAAHFAVIQQFARSGELWLSAVPADTQDTRILVHPRSMRVIGDRIVPSGFVGLPFVYGVMARAVPESALPFLLALLTPLMATVALFAFYHIVARLFADTRVAEWSTVFLALHPAWWYYTVRGLFPNVLLVSLLLISAWLFLRHRQSIVEDAAMVACGALALLVRPSEIWWGAGLSVVVVCWG